MLIKNLFLKIWRFLISPHHIRKVKEAADFHKRCEYHQQDIELLFDNEVFSLRNGSAILHKDSEGRIRKIDFDYTAWKG